ncbi:MAG: minor capsid protein, partial [Geminicoccaceae bacterium]
GIKAPRTRAGLPFGTKGKFDEFSCKRVRELVGKVPASTTFSEFLKNQTPAFQREVLGRTRAKQFRDGDIDLGDFVDEGGRMFTLDELMQREPNAFRPNG